MLEDERQGRMDLGRNTPGRDRKGGLGDFDRSLPQRVRRRALSRWLGNLENGS